MKKWIKNFFKSPTEEIIENVKARGPLMSLASANGDIFAYVKDEKIGDRICELWNDDSRKEVRRLASLFNIDPNLSSIEIVDKVYEEYENLREATE